MNLDATLATALVLAPALLGGWPLLRAGGSRAAAAGATAGSIAAFAGALGLLASGAWGPVTLAAWAAELGVSVSWRLEPAPLALAALVSGIGALVIQYAGAYFGTSARGARAIAWLSLFQSSMLGLVLSDNLFLLFVFWELTGICSFFLISLDADRRADAFPAARQALLLTAGGGLALLVAFLVLAAGAGSASLSELVDTPIAPGLQAAVLLLLLPAVATKSAQVPFHFWLPGAMAAPSPVSAYLHSATLVKAGIVLLLYLWPLLGSSPLWSATLVPLGAATCIWGSYRALGEADVKLLMAWSTVAQLGLLTLTLGLGTDVAVRAATLHLFAHAVFKAGLFLAIGAIDKAAGTRSLHRLGGLGRRAPWLLAIAAVLAASMAGVPPLAGFLSKELILKKAMLADLWIHVAAIGAIVAGSIGTVAYSSRFLLETFTGAPRSEAAANARRPPAALLLAPGLLALVSLGAGLGAPWVDRWFLEPVAASLVGVELEAPRLSLWYGLNIAFLLSVGIVAGGYFADRVLRLRMLPAGPAALRGERGFEGLLAGSQALGARVVRALAGADPRIYLVAVLLLGVAAVPFALPELRLPAGIDWSPAGGAVLVLLAAALAGLLALENRLARVLLLSAAGFAVALIFRLMSAPDLLLTQLLVEVLTTVFLVLAIRCLPRRPPAPRPEGAPRRRPAVLALRVASALAVGAGLAAAVLALDASRAPSAVREVYLEAAPELAKGLNAVNVVLTDFRALDTLVETLVVALAAFGVVALVRGRELGRGGGAR